MATPKLTPDQIAQVSELVAGHISAQREKYAPRAVPLSAQQRASVEPFFAREVIDSVRVLVLEGERVPNPTFIRCCAVGDSTTCLTNPRWAQLLSAMLSFHTSVSRLVFYFTNSCR